MTSDDRNAIGAWATKVFYRKRDRLFFCYPTSDRALRRLVMMMHVMLVDMNFLDKWRDHDCDVVREVIRVYIPLVSCPSHVAPGVTAAMYVYLGARRNDRLHPMARRRARP